MMSIRRVKKISAIIVVVLVVLLQGLMIESDTLATGSIEIHTAKTDKSGAAGELSYSGGYHKLITLRRKKKNIDTYIKEAGTLCKKGEGVNVPIIISKVESETCTTNNAFEEVDTEENCIDAMKTLNAIKGVSLEPQKQTFGARRSSKCSVRDDKWYFEDGKLHGKTCGYIVKGYSGYGSKFIGTDCICLIPECSKCPRNTYSEGGQNAKCLTCPTPSLTNTDQSKCINPSELIDEIKKDLVKQKEKTNDLSIKNSRLWQKEQIRLQHDKLMQERKSDDNKKEKDFCEQERKDGTIIFPAIEISNEIEKIEDTTCIDTNRDELLKSFCSFTSDLDKLFKVQSIDKKAKSFWPNICCKERRDTTLEVCKDPSGDLNRGEIIPFALSSGGDYSRHNLYVEVTDTIKRNGYLHKGMNQLLDSLLSVSMSKKENAKSLINTFFNEVSLCGPRIVDAPGNAENKLCELFIPYKHAMKSFYNLIKSLYMQPMKIQTSSFLETMEKSLRKRSAVKRIGKNNIQNMMQIKPAPKAVDVKCTGGSKWVSSKLKQKKTEFCHGYKHLDLSDTNIKNVAVHYLKNDISYNDTQMFRLSEQLRYEVTDSSCPAPLFTANDISIQQVAMDTLGNETEWVAVVNLNTQDENGYLQSELPYCEARDYLIGAKITVKVFEDNKGCCPGLKDFKKCEQLVVRDSCKSVDSKGQCEEYNTRQKCGDNLPKLVQDKHHNHYSKDVVLTGTQYTVKSSHVIRRRRLLQSRDGGC